MFHTLMLDQVRGLVVPLEDTPIALVEAAVLCDKFDYLRRCGGEGVCVHDASSEASCCLKGE